MLKFDVVSCPPVILLDSFSLGFLMQFWYKQGHVWGLYNLGEAGGRLASFLCRDENQEFWNGFVEGVCIGACEYRGCFYSWEKALSWSCELKGEERPAVLGVKWLLVAEISLGEKHCLRENESILGENGMMFFLSSCNLGGAEKPVQIPAGRADFGVCFQVCNSTQKSRRIAVL